MLFMWQLEYATGATRIMSAILLEGGKASTTVPRVSSKQAARHRIPLSP